MLKIWTSSQRKWDPVGHMLSKSEDGISGFGPLGLCSLHLASKLGFSLKFSYILSTNNAWVVKAENGTCAIQKPHGYISKISNSIAYSQRRWSNLIILVQRLPRMRIGTHRQEDERITMPQRFQYGDWFSWSDIVQNVSLNEMFSLLFANILYSAHGKFFPQCGSLAGPNINESLICRPCQFLLVWWIWILTDNKTNVQWTESSLKCSKHKNKIWKFTYSELTRPFFCR